MIIAINKSDKGWNKNQSKKLRKHFDELPPGNYVIEVKKNDIVGNPRGRYFMVLKPISEHTGYHIDEIHEQYKMMFNQGKSTSHFLNDQEWWNYINAVISHAQSFHGVVIPDDRDANYEAQQLIEESFKRNYR